MKACKADYEDFETIEIVNWLGSGVTKSGGVKGFGTGFL